MTQPTPLNIALDGPAGAGKSTVARRLAQQLNILYLDTGALYRTVAYAVLQAGIAADDQPAVAALLPTLDITVEYRDNAQVTYLNGQAMGQNIRTGEVSDYASRLSALPCVRQALLELQRQIASQHDCVLDGRDIGTNVLPDCPHKIFITASLQARAHRRWLEDTQRGLAADLAEVERQIALRDQRDANRAIAPLRQAQDAVLLDTSELTIDQAVEKVLAIIGR